MPSEQDKVADRLNLPLLGVAGVITVLGFVLTILIATMWIGLPLMAVGIVWAIVLFFSAKVRSRSSNLM